MAVSEMRRNRGKRGDTGAHYLSRRHCVRGLGTGKMFCRFGAEGPKIIAWLQRSGCRIEDNTSFITCDRRTAQSLNQVRPRLRLQQITRPLGQPRLGISGHPWHTCYGGLVTLALPFWTSVQFWTPVHFGGPSIFRAPRFKCSNFPNRGIAAANAL